MAHNTATRPWIRCSSRCATRTRCSWCRVLIIGVIALASLFKSAQLRGGGAVVAQSLGGVRVERDTADPARKRLRNIIEEMAIASGVPVPEIYVLEQEPAINAFAAGHTPANACITVTQGALDHLDRDELQGVIGHEFSHILNGDMRLNIQLMGAIFGLLVIAIIGRLVFNFAPRGGNDRDRRGGGLGWVGVGLAAMVLGYLGLLAGRMLQAAVSRQRERLADASAVQFTRNTTGLKGALLKIAALEEGSKFVAADAEQVAHMLFAPGLDRIFATHPPLLERIRELDPQFDPAELQRLIEHGVPGPQGGGYATPAAAPARAAIPVPGVTSGFAADAGAIAAQVGRPQPGNVDQAQVAARADSAGAAQFLRYRRACAFHGAGAAAEPRSGHPRRTGAAHRAASTAARNCRS